MKIYHDEEFSVFKGSPFEFSAGFRAVAALPRNFLWPEMIRRAGMHRFIELSSKSNIGGWAVGPPIGFNIFGGWTSVFRA